MTPAARDLLLAVADWIVSPPVDETVRRRLEPLIAALRAEPDRAPYHAAVSYDHLPTYAQLVDRCGGEDKIPDGALYQHGNIIDRVHRPVDAAPEVTASRFAPAVPKGGDALIYAAQGTVDNWNLSTNEKVHPKYIELLTKALAAIRSAPAAPAQPAATFEQRVEAAGNAVRDEIGSRLCHWSDLGTERNCTEDTTLGYCMCESVAKAAILAADALGAPQPEGKKL